LYYFSTRRKKHSKGGEVFTRDWVSIEGAFARVKKKKSGFGIGTEKKQKEE